VANVLNNSDGIGEQKYYRLLTGESSSNGTELEKLDITNSDRQYASQGIEFALNFYHEWGSVYHEIESGLRLHNDYVERNRSVKAYNMTDGDLVYDGIARPNRVVNKGESNAIAAYLKDKLTYENWIITGGLRAELIKTQLTDKLNPRNNNKQTTGVWIPGIGAFYQYSDTLGFLFGINKGFAPNGPAANDNVKPEETINTEFGFRFKQNDVSFETIGFFNRYENLIGRCRASDVDCNVGDEFNGGKVDVSGAEISGHYRQAFGDWRVPVNLTYTYTDSAFQRSFSSGFSQWGNIVKGDALPYLPRHQLRIQTGLSYLQWDASLAINFTDAMRETPGQDTIENSSHIDAHSILDVAFAYQVTKAFRAQLTIDNLFNGVNIVSRRPFGARPNKPRALLASIKYEL